MFEAFQVVPRGQSWNEGGESGSLDQKRGFFADEVQRKEDRNGFFA